MRIAFITRSTLCDSPGGDTLQVLQTARHLKDGAAEVDIFLTNRKVGYGNNDLFHFFNITGPAETLFHINRSKNPSSRSSPYPLIPASKTGYIRKLFPEEKTAKCEYAKDLQRKIIQNYDWQQTAAITMEAYKQLITA